MNKEQFLKELEDLLQDIDATEREEALNYYRDYFVLKIIKISNLIMKKFIILMKEICVF